MIRTDAVGLTADPRRREWAADDTMLYALAVGAGIDDLELTTENSQGVDLVALPTLAAVLGGGAGPLRDQLGTWTPSSLVHGTQWIELLRPLPAAGQVDVVTSVSAIEDKGSGALVELTAAASDVTSGQPLFHSVTGLFIRGEGGFGDTGSRGRALARHAAEGDPDVEVSTVTRDDQALLYRLCGDHNPLHSDPAFAARAGFPRPILHGLCTWGFAARMLGKAALGGRYERIRAFGGRFRAPVMPGDELTVRAWRASAATWSFTVAAGERIVIDSGVLEEAEW